MVAWPLACGQNILEAETCGKPCSPHGGQEAESKTGTEDQV
jgi:hypothetical protein